MYQLAAEGWIGHLRERIEGPHVSIRAVDADQAWLDLATRVNVNPGRWPDDIQDGKI
jgi:hypothetical protein